MVVYGLRGAPRSLRQIHRCLLNVVYEFPENDRPGDYLRTYELDDRALLGNHLLHRMTPAQLSSYPTPESSIRYPGRLVGAAPPGEAWERSLAGIEPTGLFVEIEGPIYRVLGLECQPDQEEEDASSKHHLSALRLAGSLSFAGIDVRSGRCRTVL